MAAKAVKLRYTGIMARRRRSYAFTEPPPQANLRHCDHPDCQEPGIYPAPRSPDQLNSYYYFCLPHVREYNAGWNFYANQPNRLSDDMRAAGTWGRPTWPFGSLLGQRPQRLKFAFDKDFGDTNHTKPSRPAAPLDERGKALQVFGLQGQVTWPRIRQRYRELVKQYHPDANGGSTTAAETFKAIMAAYATLKSFYA